MEVGDDNRLTLPRKPKKKQVFSFTEWARCFSVCAHYLASHHPQRSTDLPAYMYVIATCHAEYSFTACMAYDVAFRRKAARFCLTAWGQIDPQLYTKAFTGSGKARPRAWCDHCLTRAHTSSDCPLSPSSGSAKKPQISSQRSSQTSSSKEICRNFNHGRCSRGDCRRRHVCLTQGCLGPHPATSCPSKRSSPRKQ